MQFDKIGTTNYARDTEDLAVYRAQNPSIIVPVPQENKPSVSEKPKSDSFNTANSNVISTNTANKQYLRSNLQINIQDKDGFANFGKADLRAQISGDVTITKELILNQLAGMKDSPEQKFNPPRFDADRKQYVISGTAFNAILGVFDTGIEIRLGEKDGNLAFMVDSAIKRGSIYSELKTMLLDAGISTFEKDGNLFIKPTVGQPIDIPVSKDKSQAGRIEWIDSNLENTKASIDKYGNVNVRLKDVHMIASSNISTVNKKVEKPDVASIKFDFSLDSNMKPEATFTDGKIEANVTQGELESKLGKGNLSFMKQTFGTALSVSLTGFGGHLKVTDQGINLDTQGNVSVKSTDTDASLSTEVKVNMQDSKPVVEANNLNAKLVGNQKIIAEHVVYDGTKEGLNIEAQGLDANVNFEGVNAQVQGSAKFNMAKDGSIKSDFLGSSTGKVNRDGINIDFGSKGQHAISFNNNKLGITVDDARLSGSYDTTVRGEQKEVSEKPLSPDNAYPTKENIGININVKNIDAKATVKTSITDIDATLNQGGVKIEVGKDVKIESDATIGAVAGGPEIKGQASVKGKATLKGATVNVSKEGNVDIQVKNTVAEGSFVNDNGKVKIGGKVKGDVNVSLAPEGNISVNTQNGSFDASLDVQNKIKVKSTGKDISVAVDKEQNIGVKVTDVNATTTLNVEKVKLTAKTKGEQVTVDVKGDDIDIKSKNTTSGVNVNVNKGVFSGKATSGDVNIKIKQSAPNEGDEVTVEAKNVKAKANVTNPKGKLNVDLDSKGDLKLKVDKNSNISISSKNGQNKADFTLKGGADGKPLENKVTTKAEGKDFKVDVKGDDINIKLNSATYKGKITPGEKASIDVASAKKSDINLKISSKETYTDVNVSAKSPTKGNISFDGQLNSDFSNKDGFNLFVHDSEKDGTKISTGMNGLNLDGNFKAGDLKLGIKGNGNFDLGIYDKPDATDVDINYDGKFSGTADAGKMAQGTYDLTGKVNVNVTGDDVKVKTKGEINADITSERFGMGANVNVKGTDRDPISVSVNTKKDPIVGVNINEGGYIELKDIDKLQIGEMDATVKTILSKLKSKSAKLTYQKLDIKNNAQQLSVGVQAKGIKTEYGNIDAGVTLKRDGSTVELDKGSISLQPNEALFKLITDEVSKKYNIKITGKPELKDGQLSIKGEIKTITGSVQLADFNIKATVVDNNLVLDLDKAKVLKVISTSLVGNITNKILNRTDIEHVKITNKNIIIKLADIVKDLELTQGINFTDLKLTDNKIHVGFDYNSIDKDIAAFASKKDVAGLEQYLKTLDYKNISGEALSTAYGTFANADDVAGASKFVANLVTMYNNNPNISKTEFDRGLTWISKNQLVKKRDIQDNITLEFTKIIKMGTPYGDKLIKNLPTPIVSNFANNLDQTVSQGAGISLIFPQERSTANYLRKLKGIPQNNAMF